MEEFEHILEKDLGEVKIADDVLAVCAINAALRTPGVAQLSGGITDSLSETLLRKELLSKGVKINQTDKGVVVDVYIIVNYGVKIPVVAWDTQGNVKKELETMTSRKVLGVNIHVQGVATTIKEEQNE